MKASLKPILFLFLWLSIPGTSIAQKDSEKAKLQFEIGLNAVSFLENFVNLDDLEQVPYDLRLKFGRKKFLSRVSAGFRHQFIAPTGDTEDNQIDQMRFSGSLGFELRRLLHKKFSVNYGLEAMVNIERDLEFEVSIIDVISNNIRIQEYGGGPFVGILYHITPRFYISSEVYFYASRFETEHSRKFQENPQFDEITINNGYDFKIIPPSSLFVNFIF